MSILDSRNLQSRTPAERAFAKVIMEKRAEKEKLRAADARKALQQRKATREYYRNPENRMMLECAMRKNSTSSLVLGRHVRATCVDEMRVIPRESSCECFFHRTGVPFVCDCMGSNTLESDGSSQEPMEEPLISPSQGLCTKPESSPPRKKYKTCNLDELDDLWYAKRIE